MKLVRPKLRNERISEAVFTSVWSAGVATKP